MSAEWPLARIADIASNIAIGPFGSRMKSDCYALSGVPVIRGTNLTGGKSFSGNWVFISEETANGLGNCCVTAGDLVFPHRGSIGEVGIVTDDFPRYVMSSSLMKLTCNRTIADPSYVYYFFKSQQGKHELLKNASQVGTPGIGQPLTSLKSIEIPLPPVPVQRDIARTLGDLDDKIELNSQINQTLEQIAQTIFKSWFVDFEPVKYKLEAKAAGRDPERVAMCAISGKSEAELDQLSTEQRQQLVATTALFPDGLVDSELGLIPKGWEAQRLGDICSRVAMGPFGSDIKKDNFIDHGVPLIRGGNLGNGLIDDGFVFVSEEKADQLRNANAYVQDIVITHRGTLGQVGIIPRNSAYKRYVVSQSQMVLSVNRDRAVPRFVFEFLRSSVGQHLLLANTSQVGVPAIARPTSSVKAIPLVIPEIEVLRNYEAIAESLADMIVENDHSSSTLATLRDTLLPRLLSGELSVGEYECQA